MNSDKLTKKYNVHFSQYREFDLNGLGTILPFGRRATEAERMSVDCNPDNEVIVLPEGIFVGAIFEQKSQEELADNEHQANLDRKLL